MALAHRSLGEGGTRVLYLSHAFMVGGAEEMVLNLVRHLPPRFALKPIERSENRLKVLQRLLKRKDVDALVNACDAGREGELIFRRIVEFTRSKQPIQRLWLQSMTPAAIRGPIITSGTCMVD